jgi:Tfp pilus assembly protein PilF
MPAEITREEFLREWAETKKTVVAYMDDRTSLLTTMDMARQDLGVFYQNAWNAFNVEDYAQAENLFFTLFLWDCKDYSFQTGLAAVYEAQEKFENALSMYALAMITREQAPDLLFRSGKCLLGMGKKNEAKIMFELAAEAKGYGTDLARLSAIEKSKSILALLNG